MRPIGVDLIMLVLAASPALVRAEKPLRLPAPEFQKALSAPENYDGKLIELCAPYRARDGGVNWTIEVRGISAAQEHACLVGRLRKIDQPFEGRAYNPGRGWIFEVDPTAQMLLDNAACLPPEAMRGARIVTYKATYGNDGLRTQYGFEGEQDAARLVSVGASKSGPPIIFVAAANHSTIWNFAGIAEDRLRAVLLVGNNGQAAAHVPAGAALRFVTSAASDLSCGKLLAFRASHNPADLAKLADETLHSASQTLSDPDPVAISVDGGGPPRPPKGDIPPSSIKTAQPIIHDDVPPGIAGLAALFQSGAIRNATKADVDAWLHAKYGPQTPNTLGTSGVYVVSRAITVPREMFGSNSAKFIIPNGLPMPVDYGSHNSYFSIADGECKGSGWCH